MKTHRERNAGTQAPTRNPSLPTRLAGAFKLLFAALFVFATCGPSVDAQEDNPAAFFRADRQRMQLLRQQALPTVVQRPELLRRAAPPRKLARDAPQRAPRVVAPVPGPEPENPPAQVGDAPSDPTAPVAADAATPPKPVAAKPAEPAFTIAVIGDSLGMLLGVGLTEAFADNPEISVLRRARENTGLVRDDYFDWVKGARDLAAGAEKFNLVVMMIGSNDRQALRDAGASVELRSQRWNQAYGDRAEAVAQIFREKKIPVLWVGLPVMKNDRFSADMAAFNEIFKERAGKTGAAFIDSWDPFLDDRGQYAAYGPDVNGQLQKLRSGDGVHFTKPGARKLAYFLEAEIRRAMAAARPQVDLEIAVAPPQQAPATTESTPGIPLPPARGSSEALVLLPAPQEPPQVVIPVKPAEGVVTALTAPAVSPGGQLAGRTNRANPTDDSQALLDRVLVQGRPLDARPGRADDFSWPRR